MRILWISQNLPYPPKTGVLQRNYNLIREASTFAEVDLVAILKRDILPNFEEQTAVSELSKICKRVEVVRLPIEDSRVRFFGVVLKSLFTQAPFTANWSSSAVLGATLARALAAAHYDLVYFDTISLAGYRTLAKKCVIVLNHHNIESHLLDRRLAYESNVVRRWYFGLEARKLRRYEAAVAKDFDAHLVVSALDGQRLQEISPGISTEVVANGVDVDYFRPGAEVPEHGNLIMVSGMNWFPNRDAVLFMIRDIWPMLSDAMPNVTLTIVGASPPPAVLAIAAQDSRVNVTGFVDDVRPYMARAQVYLCPMRDGGGTRVKILDALAMGMPIVATTMALEGIDVEPGHDVLVGDTPEEFVRQIQRAVSDVALCQRIGANGRAFAERRFSWPVIGSQMRDRFQSLVNGGSRHV